MQDDDPVTLRWTFPDGAEMAGAEVSRRFEKAGTYVATVTATDEGGLSATKTVEVTVVAVAPPATTPGPSVTPADTVLPVLSGASVADRIRAGVAGPFRYRGSTGRGSSRSTRPAA